jgi:prophage antirepressor-like protein
VLKLRNTGSLPASRRRGLPWKAIPRRRTRGPCTCIGHHTALESDMTDRSIIPFLFEGEITVRVVDRDGAPWFVMTDVCRALGLTNPTETVRGLDEDEKGISITETLGGAQEMIVISESGLYALIFKSRKPNAAHFRKWVTATVLPTLRTAGRYHLAQPIGPCAQPEAGKVRLVKEARQTFGTRAAGELWFQLGLPTVAAMRLSPAQSDLFMIWLPPAVGGVAPAS